MRRLCGRLATLSIQRWQVRFWSLLLALLCSLTTMPTLSAQTPVTEEPKMPAASGTPTASDSNERVLEIGLADAIEMALQNGLEIERERLSPQIARTDIGRARAEFDPVAGVFGNLGQTKTLPENRSRVFDDNGDVVGQVIIRPFAKNGEFGSRFRQKILLGGSYEIRFVNTREDVAPRSFGTSERIVDPRYETRFELTFTQPLLKDFGIYVNAALIQQAQKATEIAEQQVLQTVLDTVFAVQQRYWTLAFRIQDLEAQRESQKLAEDFLAENTVRVELGTLAPIELVQAETRVKSRQGDVIVAEAAVREAEDQVKEILNLPETLGTWDLRVRPTETPSFAPVAAIVVEEKVVVALSHRPDFAQSQLAIASREINLKVAQNQRLPSLDLLLNGSISSFGDGFDDSISKIVEGEGYSWAVGLQFEQPLGNRLARNELERRRLELRQAHVDQRRLKRTIVRQIRQAIREIETSAKRVEVARATTTLARTQLEAEQEKFRLGLSTSFNVLEFQETLTRARTDETRALSDYNIALALLDQLTGEIQYGNPLAPAQQ